MLSIEGRIVGIPLGPYSSLHSDCWLETSGPVHKEGSGQYQESFG
jgi:hypothetical protein